MIVWSKGCTEYGGCKGSGGCTGYGGCNGSGRCNGSGGCIGSAGWTSCTSVVSREGSVDKDNVWMLSNVSSAFSKSYLPLNYS